MLRYLRSLAGLLLLAAPLAAQQTTITASHERLAGADITTGIVTFTGVSQASNLAVVFADATGAQNGPSAFACQITNGAITGMIQPDGTVAGSCTLPDGLLTNPHINYSAQVCDQSVGLSTSKTCFSEIVVGITGASFALDHYAPAQQVALVQALTYTTGTTPPALGCSPPALYQQTSPLTLYTCGQDNVFHPITGSSSATVQPATATQAGIVQIASGAGSSNTTAENAANRGAAGGYAPLDSTGKVPAANLPPTMEVDQATSSRAGIVQLAAGPGSGAPTAENVTNKGTNGGYAPLDSTGKVPSANLPAMVSLPAGTAANQVQTRNADGTQTTASGMTADSAGNVQVPGEFDHVTVKHAVPAVGVNGSRDGIIFDGPGTRCDINGTNCSTQTSIYRQRQYSTAGQNNDGGDDVRFYGAGDNLYDRYFTIEAGSTHTNAEPFWIKDFAQEPTSTVTFGCGAGCTTGSTQITEASGPNALPLGGDRIVTGPAAASGTIGSGATVPGEPFARAKLGGFTVSASKIVEASADTPAGTNVSIPIVTGTADFPYVSNSTAAFAVGNLVAVADPGTWSYFELAKVVSVPDSSHVVLSKLKYPHTSRMLVATGGSVGSCAGVTANDAGGARLCYPVVANIDATGTFWYPSNDSGAHLAVDGKTAYNSASANGASLYPMAIINSYDAVGKVVTLGDNNIAWNTSDTYASPHGLNMAINGYWAEANATTPGHFNGSFGLRGTLRNYSAGDPSSNAVEGGFIGLTPNGVQPMGWFHGLATQDANGNMIDTLPRNAMPLDVAPPNIVATLASQHFATYNLFNLECNNGGTESPYCHQMSYDPNTGNIVWNGGDFKVPNMHPVISGLAGASYAFSYVPGGPIYGQLSNYPVGGYTSGINFSLDGVTIGDHMSNLALNVLTAASVNLGPDPTNCSGCAASQAYVNAHAGTGSGTASPATSSQAGTVQLAQGSSSNTTAENYSNRGQANGYAPLDSTGKVPLANTPGYNPAQNTEIVFQQSNTGTDVVTVPQSGQGAVAMVNGLVSNYDFTCACWKPLGQASGGGGTTLIVLADSVTTSRYYPTTTKGVLGTAMLAVSSPLSPVAELLADTSDGLTVNGDVYQVVTTRGGLTTRKVAATSASVPYFVVSDLQDGHLYKVYLIKGGLHSSLLN